MTHLVLMRTFDLYYRTNLFEYFRRFSIVIWFMFRFTQRIFESFNSSCIMILLLMAIYSSFY